MILPLNILKCLEMCSNALTNKPRLSLSLSLYIYIYIYICLCICMYLSVCLRLELELQRARVRRLQRSAMILKTLYVRITRIHVTIFSPKGWVAQKNGHKMGGSDTNTSSGAPCSIY